MTDTEKVTINLSVVDLGQIDLLVEQGFYSSRSDLIRTAIRNQLTVHAEAIHQTVVRKDLALGVLSYNRAGLEAKRAAGKGVAEYAEIFPLEHFTYDVGKQFLESIRIRIIRNIA